MIGRLSAQRWSFSHSRRLRRLSRVSQYRPVQQSSAGAALQHDLDSVDVLIVSDHGMKILNIAGPRASKEPQIAAIVKKVLEEAFLPRPDFSISGPGER